MSITLASLVTLTIASLILESLWNTGLKFDLTDFSNPSAVAGSKTMG
jgi:hypothetical protein